jgi:hypothetical protein
MKTRPIAGGLIMGSLWACCWCAPACGDGGTVRLRERVGPYEVTVFTAPTPLRAGPIDISVFVQDAADGEPVPEATVSVKLSPRGRPGEMLFRTATTDAATNKLLRAALFELPAPGWWDVEVSIEERRGAARVQFALEAAAGGPRWLTLAPWLAWPALVVAFYCLHQFLRGQTP